MGLLSHVQMLHFWILIIIIGVSESRLDGKLDDVEAMIDVYDNTICSGVTGLRPPQSMRGYSVLLYA